MTDPQTCLEMAIECARDGLGLAQKEAQRSPELLATYLEHFASLELMARDLRVAAERKA